MFAEYVKLHNHKKSYKDTPLLAAASAASPEVSISMYTVIPIFDRLLQLNHASPINLMDMGSYLGIVQTPDIILTYVGHEGWVGYSPPHHEQLIHLAEE
ncbi:hypothetical protein IMZ48_49210 [Candidatus Bathyarchaeota archaeon]|nr:hypothetical protein [Candidatus Bathyarchaeota archaeon]